MIGAPIVRAGYGLFAMAALLLPGSALAEEEVLDAAQNVRSGGKPLAILSGPPSDGKEALFARGIQGAPRIQVIVGSDNRLREAVIVESSRSAELDEFALGLVRRSTFRAATDKAGRPVAIRAAFPIHLWKDSMEDGSMLAKSCGDFVKDADWFRQTFPEKQPDQLRSWLLFTGVSLARRYTSGAKLAGGPQFQTVYDACRAKPERKFVDMYKKFES